MLKGIIKVIAFYISSTFVAIAFTMLPFINNMINNTFGIDLISNELLNTFSSVGVLSVVITTLIMQAKKALEGIIKLASFTSEENEIKELNK